MTARELFVVALAMLTEAHGPEKVDELLAGSSTSRARRDRRSELAALGVKVG